MQNHERTSSIAATPARVITLVAALLIASATLTQRSAAQDESAPPPSQSTADSARAYAPPSSVWNAQRVRRVLQDGTHVVLTDGTIWEVYLPDRPSVNTWKPGDLLVVREAAVSQGDYDYTLKDGRTRGAVKARLVGDSNGRS
jgi:hypothetical protein